MLYKERQDLASKIIDKLKNKESLTLDELTYVMGVLEDPLQEFCMREGTFRLREILEGVSPERASYLEDAAGEVIRNVIDYDEQLYDKMDNELQELLNDTGISLEYDEDENASVVDHGKVKEEKA